MPRIINYPEELTLEPSDVVVIDSEQGGVRQITVDALADALIPLMNQKLLKQQAGLDKVQNTADSEKSVKYAESAGSANTASSATNATEANHAKSADTATTASSATNATNATEANHAKSADTATSATNANYATTAGSATTATSATNARTAANANKLGNQDPSYYTNYNNLSNKPSIPAAPGTASTSAAGLVTLSTASTVTTNTGIALSASEKNPNVKGSLAQQIQSVAKTAGGSGLNFLEAGSASNQLFAPTTNLTVGKTYLLSASWVLNAFSGSQTMIPGIAHTNGSLWLLTITSATSAYLACLISPAVGNYNDTSNNYRYIQIYSVSGGQPTLQTFIPSNSSNLTWMLFETGLTYLENQQISFTSSQVNAAEDHLSFSNALGLNHVYLLAIRGGYYAAELSTDIYFISTGSSWASGSIKYTKFTEGSLAFGTLDKQIYRSAPIVSLYFPHMGTIQVHFASDKTPMDISQVNKMMAALYRIK